MITSRTCLFALRKVLLNSHRLRSSTLAKHFANVCRWVLAPSKGICPGEGGLFAECRPGLQTHKICKEWLWTPDKSPLSFLASGNPQVSNFVKGAFHALRSILPGKFSLNTVLQGGGWRVIADTLWAQSRLVTLYFSLFTLTNQRPRVLFQIWSLRVSASPYPSPARTAARTEGACIRVFLPATLFPALSLTDLCINWADLLKSALHSRLLYKRSFENQEMYKGFLALF